MVVENRRTKILMTTLVFTLVLSSIVFTSFKFKEMSWHVIKSLLISFIYIIIMIPKYIQINDTIVNESIQEAKESYQERDTYKKMFDGLQEGVIVFKNCEVTFMNELSNKVLSHLADLKNYFKKINNDNSKVNTNLMDLKLFYLFQNNAQKKNVPGKSNKKKNHTSSDPSKAMSSDISGQE
jgi:hypothetical protein